VAHVSETKTPSSFLVIDAEALSDIDRSGAIKHDPRPIASIWDENGLVNSLGYYEVFFYQFVLDVQDPQDGKVLGIWFMACGVEWLMVDNGNLTPTHFVLPQHV
jgi:hypothetical protein